MHVGDVGEPLDSRGLGNLCLGECGPELGLHERLLGGLRFPDLYNDQLVARLSSDVTHHARRPVFGVWCALPAEELVHLVVDVDRVRCGELDDDYLGHDRCRRSLDVSVVDGLLPTVGTVNLPSGDIPPSSGQPVANNQQIRPVVQSSAVAINQIFGIDSHSVSHSAGVDHGDQSPEGPGFTGRGGGI